VATQEEIQKVGEEAKGFEDALVSAYMATHSPSFEEDMSDTNDRGSRRQLRQLHDVIHASQGTAARASTSASTYIYRNLKSARRHKRRVHFLC